MFAYEQLKSFWIEQLSLQSITAGRDANMKYDRRRADLYQSYSASLSAQDEGTKELCTKLQHTGSLAICQRE